ncbi:MAG TPA: DUF885 family protein [Thermoanaerobaculia bacterium]|nr:DUF885 family protein [Thermoanaerobaculia bacterium]
MRGDPAGGVVERRPRGAALVAVCVLSGGGPALAQSGGSDATPQPDLAELARRVGEVKIEEHSAEEYRAAADAYRALLAEVEAIPTDDLDLDDEIDVGLLRDHLRIRLFEIEDAQLHQVVPVRYFALSKTDGLFLRPCGVADRGVREAVEELERLPRILENARANLTRPARTWTENAIYQAWYAQLLLREKVPAACVDDPALLAELVATARLAADAVDTYTAWLERVLLPRSDRSPAWTPEQIETYQVVQEQLAGYGVDEMLRVAEEERVTTRRAMEELAHRIHPSGDLHTVWELMKEEAPPWDEVEPMAQRYVDLAAEWLRGQGRHVLDIPERFDWDAREATPMARRTLSFGGASYGPTVSERISGYYVLTPLESRLSAEEKASRIKSYNPYWTHVISYHEWVGHNVQRAYAQAGGDTPVRRLVGSAYFSQAWSFYLEKLFEDEGYYHLLPHLEALKTRMARLQMRMWRVQRILTKLKMAKGELTFDQAVQAYVDEIGMEPTNAFIEVQRDSQTPASPGREIIGERVILEIRDEYGRRLGPHYDPARDLKQFHRELLRHGDLPLPAVRRLMFRD